MRRPCPCSEADVKGKPTKWWYSPVDNSTHPGCANCYRSLPVPNLKNALGVLAPGQQCCYDKSGQLITDGSGAGTIDKVNSISNPLLHFATDVWPSMVCNKAGMTAFYLERRPQDRGPTGKPCTDNYINEPEVPHFGGPGVGFY